MHILDKPVRFDKEHDCYIIAKKGMQFFVCSKEEIDKIYALEPEELEKISLCSLATWAMDNNYPILKFVKLQRLLLEKD